MPELNDASPKKPFWWKYRVEVLIVLSGLAIMNFIFIARAFRQTYTVDRESAAQLGAFVGGYVGPFFTLIGIVLLVTTLRSQKEASEKQHFETKYFELVKMHRDNVAELDLQETSGSRLFVLMIRELRCVLEVLRKTAEASDQELTQTQALHIAYYCLFYGVGPNSSRMLKLSLPEFDPTFIDAVEGQLNKQETKDHYKNIRKFGYVPFEGHQSRLGHYYRHLYQMVRYVDQQTIDIEKYEYVKTIRAQLSTHEQALLLINSLTPTGQNWWQKGVISKYRLVQNIPRGFFDSSTELDMNALFKPGYFEWEEPTDAT
jgi:uncharacterized protein YlbG (UPF0298 family)